jgi:hypothetical protein
MGTAEYPGQGFRPDTFLVGGGLETETDPMRSLALRESQ